MEWMERWQVPLYLMALASGGLCGYFLPGSSPALSYAVNPCLILLLYITFLAVPFRKIKGIDLRFMGSLAVLNFLVAPLVVWILMRLFAVDHVGVLLVLLAPCIDYVMVFTRLAGGDHTKLLAVSPMLMLLQMLFLPLYLVLFGGVAQTINWFPFVQAFGLFIVLPLGLALITHSLARCLEPLMVPLMMLTLFVVVASQFSAVAGRIDMKIVGVYVAFLVIMPPIGNAIGRLTGQGTTSRRALAFSGATRNSLVVLPLALTIPGASIVVVTQTLVELVGMAIFVRIIPQLIRF